MALRGQQTVLRDFTIQQMLEKTSAVFGRVAGLRQTELLTTASLSSGFNMDDEFKATHTRVPNRS
jgi:hypothetical protein